ncbi:serine hydrolase domain-containing protein [Bradyrhizobium ganzhouense]|uniref:serine hydrolase domain-containing protein n=1 Tax=Bradyrhizobium ganzhouense TaxID=1179767 RepID=UPI003CF40341
MRMALRIFGIVVGILALAILGFGGWIVIARQDVLQLVSAAAAKTVCWNVFMAGRDPDAIVQADLVAVEHPIFRWVKIDVNAADHRVDAGLFGFIAERHARYIEGRGCTNVLNDQSWKRPAAQQLPPRANADALWPTGEKVELSEDTRLQAAVNDPALQGPGMRAIVVVHDGRIVAEAYGRGFSAATTLQGWSMTKSVTAALVGMAIKDGKISLDQKHLFPQWAGDARAEISIADLMAMTGGLKWSEDQGRITDPGRMEYLVRDTAAFARDLPLDAPPGTRFNYSSAESVLLTRLWQDAVGEMAPSYPRERLFNPLGMTSAVLEADEAGTFRGEGFLFATAHDWARFGEFLRLGGKWNGEQLLPPGFVDYMRSPSPVSDEGHGPVYGRGQIWLAKGQGFDLPADTFMMQGHLRQVIAIIPSRKLVILRMGLTREDIGFSNAKLLRAIVAAGF